MTKRFIYLLPFFFIYGCNTGSQPASSIPVAPPGDAPPPSASPGEQPDPPEPVRASVWLSTYDGSQRLAEQPSVAFSGDAEHAPGSITIDVDETQSFQTIAGFGAALTDSSAWLIGTRMSAQQRAELMLKLFDEHRGIGLSYLRHGSGPQTSRWPATRTGMPNTMRQRSRSRSTTSAVISCR